MNEPSRAIHDHYHPLFHDDDDDCEHLDDDDDDMGNSYHNLFQDWRGFSLGDSGLQQELLSELIIDKKAKRLFTRFIPVTSRYISMINWTYSHFVNKYF